MPLAASLKHFSVPSVPVAPLSEASRAFFEANVALVPACTPDVRFHEESLRELRGPPVRDVFQGGVELILSLLLGHITTGCKPPVLPELYFHFRGYRLAGFGRGTGGGNPKGVRALTEKRRRGSIETHYALFAMEWNLAAPSLNKCISSAGFFASGPAGPAEL